MNTPLATSRAQADHAVATAEQEAKEAAGLVAALEERVRNGDDTVTPEQIASARELGSFAQLRADATARKAADAKRTARLAACDELRQEIEEYEADNGDQAAQLLDTAYAALVAVIDHMHTHSQKLTAWRDRMLELDIPEHLSPLIPAAAHGHLGRQGRNVIAANTVHRSVDPGPALKNLAAAADLHKTGTRGALAAAQKKVDEAKQAARQMAPRAQLTPGKRFFRGPNGVPFTYDPDRAPSPEEQQRLQLVEISQEEAYGA